MQCWIALTPNVAGAASAHQLITTYSYESDERSKKQIMANDLLFMRDETRLLLAAHVERVASERREERVLKCPVCGIGKIETRKKRELPFRCFHGHQFKTPTESRQLIVTHDAHFPHAHVRVAAQIEPAELRPFELTNSRHVKLKPADAIGLCSYVARRDHTIAPILRGWLRSRIVELGDREAYGAEAHSLPVVDEQDLPFQAIRARRGSTAFREKLIGRYGQRCMISGCNVLALLEACHVSKYHGPEGNHPANGVLLRSDLHTLFDLDLIGINPADLEITVHPALAASEYQKFAGARLLLDSEKGIDMRAVRGRWNHFLRKLAGAAHDMPSPAPLPGRPPTSKL